MNANLETLSLTALHAELARLNAIPANRRTIEVKAQIAAIADEIDEQTFDWSEADRAA